MSIGLLVASASPEQRMRRIVVASLRAAFAWSVRATRQEAMPEICRMTGVVMEALGPGRGPVAPMELVHLLHGRLGAVLGDVAGGDTEIGETVLLEAGRMTEAAISLAAEYVVPLGLGVDAEWLPSWTRMRAEEIEHATFMSFRANKKQDEYVRSRRFIIEHPAGSHEVVTDIASRMGIAGTASYMELADDQVYRTEEGHRWWWSCAQCRWPMRVSGRRVRCWYAPHRPVYEIQPGSRPGTAPRLLRVDEGPPRVQLPQAQDAAGACCVEAGVWRHIVVPGSTELRILRELESAAVQVEIWPELDAYDLHVVAGTETFKVDVKEYRSASQLIEKLRARPPRSDVVIVLPKDREEQRPLVSDALPGIRVWTESWLRSRVRRAVRSAA